MTSREATHSLATSAATALSEAGGLFSFGKFGLVFFEKVVRYTKEGCVALSDRACDRISAKYRHPSQRALKQTLRIDFGSAVGSFAHQAP